MTTLSGAFSDMLRVWSVLWSAQLCNCSLLIIKVSPKVTTDTVRKSDWTVMLCWLTSHLLTPTTRQNYWEAVKHEILKRDSQLLRIGSLHSSLPDTLHSMIMVDTALHWHILMITRMWPQTRSWAKPGVWEYHESASWLTDFPLLLCYQFSESTGWFGHLV